MNRRFNRTAKEDHLEVLKVAEEVLIESDKTIAAAKQRLNNALKRYEERGKSGPSKLI